MAMQDVFRSQYGAALAMLEEAVAKCPEALWNAASDKNKLWHVAYHALFYTHLYLQASEKDFTPWAKHRENYQFLGTLPWPPHDKPQIGEPYTKEDILAYVEVCRAEIDKRLVDLDGDAPSGFYWLRFSRLELQIYNIRHLQQHTGELMERLGTRAGIDVSWVGTR